jgi:hypothetical protein
LDDSIIREEIDNLYEITNQVILAKWSLSIAKHILVLIGIDYNSVDVILEGFEVNEMWQSGNARMYDVRQSSFKVHKLARETNNKVYQTALRVVGQAVASGHMREHSMVASDYAVKVIGLLSSNNLNSITQERKWQLEELKKIIKSN